VVAPAYPLDIARLSRLAARFGGNVAASSWHFVCFQWLMALSMVQSIDALSFDATHATNKCNVYR